MYLEKEIEMLRDGLVGLCLFVAGCSNSVGPASQSDGGMRGSEVGICTGICFSGTECLNGLRQTGNGRCLAGVFTCDTIRCGSDAGTGPD